jgi:L-threonylcarbamoyladenylate synthase
VKTTVLNASERGAIERAADCLRSGGLVAFPTETVYGLGVNALDAAAVRRLFEAKGRPADDPLIVHVASIDQVSQLVSGMPERALELAQRFWPGPLTLVMPRGELVPREVTAGLDTVAVRMPAHPVARALLEAARVAIAAPSANLFSRPSPTRASHVLNDLEGRIDMVLDGGATTVGIESTVLDMTGPVPRILRPGAVTPEMLRPFVGSLEVSPPVHAGPVSSPGLLPRHYAPRTPMTLYEGDRDAALQRLLDDGRRAVEEGKSVGVLVTREDVERFGEFAMRVSEVGSERDLSGVAARLYSALRELDAAGVDVILARDVGGDEGLAAAIRDRLRRAAVNRIVVNR